MPSQPLARAAVLHRPPPAFVRQIPGDRLGKPGGEIARRPIAQPGRDLALVNGIAAVVAGAVGDIGLEFGRRAAPGGGRIWKAGGKRRNAGERIVYRSTKRLDDGAIGQLGPAADVEALDRKSAV